MGTQDSLGVPAPPSGSTSQATAIPTASARICANCVEFKPDDLYRNLGACRLMGDSNELSFSRETHRLGDESADDKAHGWDAESYRAGIYVGRSFGCIHYRATGTQA